MKTIPLRLRHRIIAACERGDGTREQIAERFSVSLGMVKKLLQQWKETGDLAPLHHRSGRKPLLLEKHREKLRTLLAKRPNLTLEQLRKAIGVDCTLPAIHRVLAELGLTRAQRHPKQEREKKGKTKAAPKRR